MLENKTHMPETITYLEMTDASQLRPSPVPQLDFVIQKIDPPDPNLSRDLYCTVGKNFRWVDRLVWTDQQWLDYLHRPDIETWVMWAQTVAAGYFEFQTEADGGIKITYFGLTPAFIGRGLGGHMLTLAVGRAWANGATRVWLHTSTNDHANALANYQARGFQIFRTEQRE